MDQKQCNELRDLLFAAKFASGSKEGVFRYLAVVPSTDAYTAATVHYSYAPPSWERAGEQQEAEAFLRNLIAHTAYAGERIALQYHDYLRNGWSLPWELTAKASHNDFPTLVLHELANGRVAGVLMRNAQVGRTMEKIADAFVEPGEVDRIIGDLRYLKPNARYMSWYKDSNLDAASLDEAVASTPETDVGQKEVLIYREGEWLWGLWNNPAKHENAESLHLSSVADFHGTRVSAAKRATRVGLDGVRANKTLRGDCAVLTKALALLGSSDMTTYASGYEATPAVRLLCDWWNAQAPEGMRHAGLFRTYTWAEADRIFVAGDPEEPALQATVLANEGCYALFEREGQAPLVIQFLRGQVFNTALRGGTQTYLANGAEGMDIGLGLREVDEAYYAVKGLQAIHRDW